jgi:hypothetical protein
LDGDEEDEESIPSTEERSRAPHTHELITFLNEFRLEKNRSGWSTPHVYANCYMKAKKADVTTVKMEM